MSQKKKNVLQTISNRVEEYFLFSKLIFTSVRQNVRKLLLEDNYWVGN